MKGAKHGGGGDGDAAARGQGVTGVAPADSTTASVRDDSEDEVLALRDLWLSRLMFNVFVGWEPEKRTFPEFLEAHGVR